MTAKRQQAFQTLRPPCVELSSVALQFKSRQSSVKQVFHASKNVRDVLHSLGEQNLLDEKLAEYAFFPLSHVFNESRRLSSTCLELAIQCVGILVSKGWRQQLASAMGKQLLILMTLLAGGDPQNPKDPPPEELKATAFDCVAILLESLKASPQGRLLFDDAATKAVIDRLVYVILETVESGGSQVAQVSAAHALLELHHAINDRTLLASLLPRTISSLTKALRPSTQARRSQKVTSAYLNLVTVFLRSVLADRVIFPAVTSEPGKGPENPGAEILDESWLKATAPQVKNALIHMVNLRTHEAPDVRKSLMDLCVMVLEECATSLEEAVPIMIETMVSLAQSDRNKEPLEILKHFVISTPNVADILQSKFYDWSLTLPRVMLAHDERPKQQMLGQFATSFALIVDNLGDTELVTSRLAKTLLDSISATETLNPPKVEQIDFLGPKNLAMTTITDTSLQLRDSFSSVVFNHHNQFETSGAVQRLIDTVKEHGVGNAVTRHLVNSITDADINRQITAIWLSLKFLSANKGDIEISDMIEIEPSTKDLALSRPFLVSDLYALTLPFLVDHNNPRDQQSSDWRLSALALECLVLQAEQLGTSYRPELIDTLYPLLSLLGSRNPQLQNHAMTALNLLATACCYGSASDMLIENVDYLVNSISMKLNGFDIAPQAPQVLMMMVRLCGARLTPYLDDVIGSIFGAIDSFHGYTFLIEALFEVLQSIVDENTKGNIAMTITNGEFPKHEKEESRASTIDDILQDLRARKLRKERQKGESEEDIRAPHQPWKSEFHGQESKVQEVDDIEEETEDLSTTSTTKNKEPSLSKSHHLLLNIAQATAPHLASPSAHVRHILLQLLSQVSSLLARDENSYLPLINTLWPAILPLLLSQTEGAPETTYNACAAAKLMSNFCEGAGDFMASRVEQIFPQLEKVFKEVYGRIHSSKSGSSRLLIRNQPSLPGAGIVNLEVSKNTVGSGDVVPVIENPRTANIRLLSALIDLLISIISYVRVTDDNGDRIMRILMPRINEAGGDKIRNALRKYNSDALWLAEYENGH